MTFRHPFRPTGSLPGLAAATALLALAAVPGTVHAEGSRTLFPATYPATRARASMDLSGDTQYVGQVNRRQFLYVYARAGEYILLGSRNRLNTGAGGDIRVWSSTTGNFGPKGWENVGGTPQTGTQVFSCDLSGVPQPANSFAGTTRGAIATRAEELAGPHSADGSVLTPGGFTPCAYAVPTTGVYGVTFTTRSGAGAGNKNVLDPPAQLSDAVSAWDVTVRSSATSTTDLNGRLFTYAWAGFTGGNNTEAHRLNHTLYYVTSDGYRYEQIQHGIDPNGYAMYANRSGFLDGGSPLYKDVRPAAGASAPLVNPLLGGTSGISAEPPQYPVFFSSVATTAPHAAETNRVLARLGIPAVPPVPQLSNPQFEGNVGGSTSTVGAGGMFRFDTVNTLSFEIVISRDGINFDPANPLNRVITGVAETGAHAVYWNGKDNAGANFPAGFIYDYRIAGRNGEVHFPLVDAEANLSGGPTINKLNGTGGSRVYYDDRGYVSRNGVAVGTLNGRICGGSQAEPVANHSLVGVDSSVATGGNYYRTWNGTNANTDCGTGGFGDAKGMDTWAFEETAAIVRQLDVVGGPVGVDVGTSASAAASVFPGQTVNGSFVFRNDGDTGATGVTYTVVLGDPGTGYCPASAAFPLVPVGVVATFNPLPLCTVTFTGMPTALNPGQSLVFNFTYPAPGPGTMPITTTIAAGNESPSPGTSPNTATAQTIIADADVATTVTVPATATAGSTVNGTIVFSNLATATATAQGVTYTATIGTPGSCPAGVTLAVPPPPGASYTYDNATCAVTFTGMPTILAPGDTINVGFSYTAPSSAATIPVNASIGTTTPETQTTNNSANGQTTINLPTATLAIVKTAVETSVAPGTNASYTIVVTNNGPDAAANVVVDDTTPAGLTFVSNTGDCTTAFPCNLGTLANGATRTITTTFSVPANYAGVSPITNVASVASPTDPSGPHTDDATTPVVANAALTILKTALDTSVAPGTNATYTIVVTNNGPSDAANVTVTDPAPAGLTFVSNTGACTAAFPCNLGTIPAGQNRTITTTFSVPANYAGASPITNVATVSSPSDPSGPHDDDATTPVVANAALAIVKTALETSVTAGNTASYTIVVTNNGPSDAANVTVSDPTPAGLTFVSNTGACATAFPCNLGTIPSGQNRTITTTFSVPSNYAGASPITNVATVGSPSDPSGPHQDDATTPVVTNAALAIVKTALETSVTPGNNATYTIVVTNNGPSDAANVVVTDPTPAGLTFVSNAGACATAFPCNLGTIPNGESRTITTTFSVPSNYTGASPIVNLATVSSPSDPSGPHSDDATTPVGAAEATLAIVKTAVETSVVPGNNASYTIVVTNNGPSDAANVVVTDPAPAGLTFVSNAGACATAFPCNLGTIPNGESRTITTTFSVPSNYSGTNPITNVATVTSPTDPSGPHSDDATTPVGTANAVLAIVKTAVETSVVPGNNASYTIVVTNNGPSDAANVVVTDPAPAGLTFVSNAGACATAFPCNLGTIPNGESRTITTTFSVPSNYAGTNPITNVATVASPTDPSGPHSDDATTPVDAANAVLAIVKTAVETSVIPGNTASYTIAVTNNGPSDAANVVVSDTTPAGLTFVSNAGACTTAFPCNLGTVPAGETRTITTVFQVPSDYAGANPIVNVASVASPTDPSGPHQDDATTPVGAANAVLAIVKTAVETSVIPGNNASYTIAVTNNGPSDAANVVVSDTTPAGLTFVSNAGACTTAFPCNLGTVPAGETRTITTTFSVPSNYTGANPIVNVASVTSPTDPSGPHQDDATTPVGTANAVLAIVKTAVETSVVPGDTASYTIVVTNNGPSDAASVVVNDTTPAGLTFVSNAGACTTAFPCNLGTIPNGESRTITTVFQVPSNYAGANPIVNVASVTSPTDPSGPHTDDATTPVGDATAALVIVKTALETSVTPGGNASYTIAVTNNGPSDATGVVVSDPTPAGLVFVSNTGACTTAFPCTLGTVPAGETRTITTTFQVPANYAGPSPIVNLASVDSPDDPTGPHDDDATTPIGDAVAQLAIVKTATQGQATPGQAITYSIVVTNNGPSDAANVVVTDPTPAGLVFLSNAGACTTAFPCALGTIPNGQSRTITTMFQVPATYAGPSPILNVATVSSPSDPNGDQSDDAVVPLQPNVDAVAIPVGDGFGRALLMLGLVALAGLALRTRRVRG